MNVDIGSILNDWPFEPGQVSARRIRGADGRDKIQLRLDMGLLQMEVAGRPDGVRPHGFECLLHYYEDQLNTHRHHHDGSEMGFSVDEDGCERLRNEAQMYYHRYLAEFVLEDYPAVERDTSRNLRAMDFLAMYAREESDRVAMEQYRPYVVMMLTRARARRSAERGNHQDALGTLRRGIERIKRTYQRMGQEELVDESGELAVLRAMIKEFESQVPVDPTARLRGELDKAIREERYEDAATIRDQLKGLSG